LRRRHVRAAGHVRAARYLALAANPAAAAFYDTLAQFYCKAYLRWIDSITRRPDLRAARIAMWGSRMRPLALIWAFMRLARIR
jgi:hypothetical protein